METKQQRCQSCGTVIAVFGMVGRRDGCPNCGIDLHACTQCEFFDLSASNQCREAEAERVGDKENANHCEFFRLSRVEVEVRKSRAVEDARAKLEALFKK